MMNIVCFLEEEKLGTVSSDEVELSLIKLWIIGWLYENHFSFSGFRIFLFYGDKDLKLAENENPDVTVWKNKKREKLIFVNEAGDVWLHKNKSMENYHPAKEEEVLEIVKMQMKK